MSENKFNTAPDEWTYLGDGLYAQFDGWQFTLCANNPSYVYSPTVYIEYATFLAFLDFVGKTTNWMPKTTTPLQEEPQCS